MITLYYIRYSSHKQGQGDSVQRQTAMLDSYRLQCGLPAPTKIYSDLGVSAYDGDNVSAGELGTLLQDLQSGLYRNKGPITLLVESIDRLSRGKIQNSTNLVQQLQAHATVVTVIDGARYEQGNDAGLLEMMTLLIKASVAHEESAKKSVRSIKAHARAREQGKRINSVCKRWLQVREDRTTLTVKEDEASVIRELYRLKRLGYGIRRLLTSSEELTTALSLKPYSHAHMGRLFHDSELVDYGVISSTDFEICKSDLRVLRSGRASVNLFRGMFKCGKCGQTLVYKAPTGTRTNGYLYCTTRNLRGAAHCDFPMLNYGRFERLILDSLSLFAKDLFAHQVIDIDALQAKKDDLQAELLKLQRRLDMVTDMYQDDPEDFARYVRPARDSRNKAREDLAEATTAHAEAVANLDNAELVAPTTEEERQAFTLRLTKALPKQTISLSEDGEHC